MPAPILLAVDDDSAALADVERELNDRYGRAYRVVCTGSAEEALATLADCSEEVALVLAEQWMDEMTGSELLERARELHPHAKRCLLVPWRAWADAPTAKAIFDSMALGTINYYVLKPASDRDEVFHQAVTGFLYEWSKARGSAPHTVRVVGADWSGRAYELREVFQRCAVPHTFCLADSEEGCDLLAEAGPDQKLPLIVLPDGNVLSDPSNTEIAEAVGAKVDPEQTHFDVVIVGAGPAGLSAAVYGASEGLGVMIVDQGGVGGQATSSSLIRNYLGFPRGVSGGRLAEQAMEQAWVFRAEFVVMHEVTGLHPEEDRLALTLSSDRSISARAVILATGASYRRLGVPELEALNGAGVFYGGPASEAPALTGREAFVVGGANSAGQAALHLARYAGRVTLVARGDSLEAGMSHYLVHEIGATPNIDVRTSTEVVGGGGSGRLEHLVLRANGAPEEETVAADGLFVLIGARPCTQWLPEELARDSRGFLLTGADLPDAAGWPLERQPLGFETSMPGVFAAGDVRHGSVKRVASAVGEGGIAIQQVHSLFASEHVQPQGSARPDAPKRLASAGP